MPCFVAAVLDFAMVLTALPFVVLVVVLLLLNDQALPGMCQV
jgi:hypothetical protein